MYLFLLTICQYLSALIVTVRLMGNEPLLNVYIFWFPLLYRKHIELGAQNHGTYQTMNVVLRHTHTLFQISLSHTHTNTNILCTKSDAWR